MKLGCGFVIYVINRIILKINQNILNPNTINVVKYELIKPNINEIVFMIDNCLRDYYYNYFHTFETVYVVEMENGHSFNSILFDKKLNQTFQKNGFIHELTIKINSHQRYLNKRYYLKH